MNLHTHTKNFEPQNLKRPKKKQYKNKKTNSAEKKDKIIS